MNIVDETILAGGPGSGCRGDHCGRPAGSGSTREFREGDKVKILKPVRTWDERTWERKTHPPGSVGRVLKVLPKVGDNPERLLVRLPHSTEEYVDTTDVTFHKIAGQPFDPKGGSVKSKPLSKEWNKYTVKMPTGGRYGIARETKLRKERSKPARGWVGDRMANSAN